jgi:hypothetical protein
MTMPFPRTKEKGFTGGEATPVDAGLEFTAAGDQQREAEFRQRPPVPPLEIEKRGVRLRVRFARHDAFPPDVGQVQCLVEQRFIHRQCVAEGLRQAHFFGLLNQKLADSSISSDTTGSNVVAIAIARAPEFGIQSWLYLE